MSEISTNLRKYQTKNGLKLACINSFQKKLIELIRDENPTDILDVGCGEAFNIEAVLKTEDITFTGVDLSKDAIELAKQRVPNATFQSASIYELPFDDSSFDLVLCNEVLEHIDNPKAALAELLRVSRGKVIVSVPHEPWFRIGNLLSLTHVTRLGNPEDHINHWSLSKFKREFSVVATIDKTKLAFPWIITKFSNK